MTNTRDEGQTLVEVAISMFLLVLFTMAAIDCGYLFCTKLTLQNAVRQAGRYAITGQCITGSNGSCSETRYNSVITTLLTTSDGFLNASNAGDITISCTNEGGGCPNNTGGPGDLVTISVAYPYGFISPLMGAFFTSHAYTIKVSATFTNEPFPPTMS